MSTKPSSSSASELSKVITILAVYMSRLKEAKRPPPLFSACLS
jgi:hypothetical protein